MTHEQSKFIPMGLIWLIKPSVRKATAKPASRVEQLNADYARRQAELRDQIAKRQANVGKVPEQRLIATPTGPNRPPAAA